MKDKIVKTKKFVYKHRVAIAIIGTATFCMYLNRAALEQHNDFLKENNLYAAFYDWGME